MPPSGRDAYNIAGRPQVALPKFVCFTKSHKLPLTKGRPGSGLLIHCQSLLEPTADIRELLMGFHIGDTTAQTNPGCIPTAPPPRPMHRHQPHVLAVWSTSPPAPAPHTAPKHTPTSPPPLSLSRFAPGVFAPCTPPAALTQPPPALDALPPAPPMAAITLPNPPPIPSQWTPTPH